MWTAVSFGGWMMGMREIKDNADALAMVQSVDLCKEIKICAKVTRVVAHNSSDVTTDGRIAGNKRAMNQGVDIALDNGDTIGEEIYD